MWLPLKIWSESRYRYKTWVKVRSLQKIFTFRKRAFKTTAGEFWNTLRVRISDVIAQVVGNTTTKPHTANVQRDRGDEGYNSDQTISDYYKVNVVFMPVCWPCGPRSRLKILTTSSRLNSQCRQTVDGNAHWHAWSNWNSRIHSFLYKNVVFPAQAEYSYFSANFRLKIFL